MNPGKYDVKVTCVGYNPKQVNGVLVTADKSSFANFELGKGVEQKAVEVVEYSVPLIDKGSPSTAKTVTYEEIQAAPTRDVNSIASQTAGVYQKDQGDALNIRGSRSDGTVYFVDGIKVRGSLGLPQKGQEQITVITGGVPAQYGDATGGIISITTRGPSREFAGGIELATSAFFDDYGYKLAVASSYGMYITGGSSSAHTPFIVQSASGADFFKVRGDGYLNSVSTYNNTTASPNYLSISSSGFFERYVASSARYKREIKDWNDNGLDIIMALKPKTYKYKKEYYSKADVDFLGLIAEEVAEVNTYLADYENEDGSGQVENVRYATIVVPLIKAVQEQNQIIQELSNRLIKLESK